MESAQILCIRSAKGKVRAFWDSRGGGGPAQVVLIKESGGTGPGDDFILDPSQRRRWGSVRATRWLRLQLPPVGSVPRSTA